MIYKPPLLFRNEREVTTEEGIPKVRWLLAERQVFRDEDGAYYVRLTTYERVKPFLQSAAILFGLWYFMTHLITMSEEGRIMMNNFARVFYVTKTQFILGIALLGLPNYYKGIVGRAYFTPKNEEQASEVMQS